MSIASIEHSQAKQFALNGHSRPVKMVRYNFDGDMFFTCSDDKQIIAWSNEGAEKLGIYEGKGACKSLAVSRHTEYIVGGYAIEGVAIFEAQTGELIYEFKPTEPGAKCNYVEFNYGDTELLVLQNDSDGKSHVYIYDFNKLLNKESKAKKVFNFKDHDITQASYGYLNENLYVSTNLGEIMIYNLASEEKTVTAKVHPGFQIFSFSFSKDFSMLASWAKDGKWNLLHPETLEILKIYDKKAPWRCASFSPLFNPETGDKYHILIGGGQDARDVTQTAENEGSFETRLYNIIYEEEMAQIKGHFGPVHSIQISPDGKSFVTVSEDGTVRLQRFPLEYYIDF